MKGYFNNKTATKQAFNFGGWFRTGDKANFSTDGRIFIEGRYKVNAGARNALSFC